MARPIRFGLQRHAGPRGRGDAELAGVRGADCRADRRNLVLRLEGRHIVFLEMRQVMQDAARRRNGIGAEEHRQRTELAASHEPERSRLGAGDRLVKAGLHLRRRDLDLVQQLADFGGFAVGMAGVERRDVGAGNRLVLFAEFLLDPGHHRLAVAVEHPQRKAERPHVLAAQRIAGGKPVRLHRLKREPCDVERHHLERRERVVFQRVGRHSRPCAGCVR